jgi:hypothetical protein
MYGDESEFGEIYIIKNFVNGKRYIGQTVQSSQERFSQHIREAYTKGRKEYNYCLSRGMKVFGIGLGICPYGIEKLFPYVIYSKNPMKLIEAISECCFSNFNKDEM